jgi:transcriptional regulator with GAF, ATPase, and Fis domain
MAWRSIISSGHELSRRGREDEVFLGEEAAKTPSRGAKAVGTVSMQNTIQSVQDEINRLSRNNQLLFDLLPDMLFIIRKDLVIERMNKAARDRFGNREGSHCHKVILGEACSCGSVRCPFRDKEGDAPYGQVFEKKIHDDFYVEYTYVPFEGYTEEDLALLILRDITKQKQYEIQLQKYNENIEKTLKEKIELLRESERERDQLYNELNHLKQESLARTDQGRMLGESKPMRELRNMIHQVAASNATILITGESGTGKELVADMIYQHSDRVGRPYLKFNCAAMTESLLESELFGYEKGAFTGATSMRKGKFEEAHGGTIFLDEIGNISAKMQTGLLRVLQEGEVVRVGANRPISVDVRVIAATNTDLAEAVRRGEFREDLYYRLNVINLRQVPLRERKEDIPMLATNFLIKYRERFNKEVTFLPNSVIDELIAYDWPGNVRELENAIQRAVLLAKDGMITPEDLGLGSRKKQRVGDNSLDLEELKDLPLKKSLARLESRLISCALQENSGRIEDVCERLGVGRTTLYEKMKRHGIRVQEKRRDRQA